MKLKTILALAIITSSLLFSARADITGNLVLYLPFDEGSGTNAADASGQGHGANLVNFTNNPGSQWVPGVSGNALLFDRNNNLNMYVVTTNTVALTNNTTQFTFAFWAKAYNPIANQNPRIIEPSYGSAMHWILSQPNKGPGFYNTSPTTTDISTNYWHHYVVTYIRPASATSPYKVYVDGVWRGQATSTAQVKNDPNNLPWIVGHAENLATYSPNDNYYGYLDEVRMYNRVLTSNDVQELYLSTPYLTDNRIITQPVGVTTNRGDWYVMSVAMLRNEAGLNYQWYLGGSAVAGATSSSVTLKPVEVTNSGDWTVVITNVVQSVSWTSTVATLNVLNLPADTTNALIAHYPFDETTGTAAADASGNGYSATLANFTHTATDSWWVSGVPGITNAAGRSGALQFNSLDTVTNEYVITDGVLTFTNAESLYTFAFWAKRTSDNNPYNPRFVTSVTTAANQHWVIWRPGFGVGFWQPAVSAEPMKFAWQHFAVTYNRTNGGNGQYSLFVNGVKQVVASPIQSKTDPNLRQWVMGHDENLAVDADPWRGYLDDVRIYNRLLTPNDIAGLYNMAITVPPEFVVQPQGADLFVGDTLRLSTSVSGTTPIAYQWYKDSAVIPNATNLSYTIPGVQTGNAGDYKLVAQGPIPPATTSVVAHVTVTAVTSVTNGLAGYWKFDETSGSTATDSSGRGNNGTVNNGPSDGGQWTSGKVGGALQFRGSGLGDDHVIIPGWPRATNGTMTFSAWVLADANVPGVFIAGGGSGADGTGQFAVNTPSTLDLRGAVENSFHVPAQAHGGGVLPVSAWQHVAIVANGTNLLVYRNDIQVASVAYDGTLFNPTNALSIGALLAADDGSAQSGTTWQGKIDEVAYWSRALSPAEVFAVSDAGTLGYPVTQADLFTNVVPIITAQPQGGTVYLHDPLSLVVVAISPTPLSYQWWKDSAAIVNATNATFANGAVDFVDAGGYTVVVSNSGGSVTSAPAVITIISAPMPQVDEGLALHLKLDETSGTTAADATTNANNGTLVNFSNPDANWVPGVLNNALLFNQGGDLSDVVQVPSQAYLDFGANSFSLSLWVKAPGTQANGAGLIAKGTGGGGESFAIDWSPGRGYRFFVRDTAGVQHNSEIDSGVNPSGNWQHIGVIYDTAVGQSRMYVDGVLRGTGSTESSLLSSAEPVDIGARDSGIGGLYAFPSTLDDVRIYARAITPLEVRALNYQGRPSALSITRAGGQVTVGWPFEVTTVYDLQAAPDLGGAWTNVPSITTNSLTVTPSLEALFYRLHRK